MFDERMRTARSRQNTHKNNIPRIKNGYRKRSNSSDDWKFVGSGLKIKK